ncbi:LLM class flavin-dependent oxidoreductase [Streptomyces hainanensis]|uniref:LLM class flavin-dependent oxidoreductase n=1 Tax=Streptomyces hainanensis TaxID=402648 RepID=UPI001404C02F|nr:LLM class flavin-dependent oxidoreductase [Streptomyces hainanensis]
MTTSIRPARFSWFLPLSPDVHHIGTWPPECGTPDLPRLTSIAQTAEDAGCSELLVPTTFDNDLEAFTTAAAVLSRTSRVGALIAVRPNQLHPCQAAHMVASLEAIFPGRIRLNVTTGGWAEDRWIGDTDDRESRLSRLSEWLELLTRVLYDGRPVHHHGTWYNAEGMRLRVPPGRRIPLAMSGSSPQARQALSQHGSEYLMFAAPREQVVREVRALRATPGLPPDIKVTMRAHLVVRETTDEAWAAAHEITSQVSERVLATVQAQRHAPGSQRTRQSALSAGNDLVVGPNLWAGIGTARFGASIALVGDPEQITERLTEFREDGVDGFILSGYPKLEEAQVFRDVLVPSLRARGLMGGRHGDGTRAADV